MAEKRNPGKFLNARYWSCCLLFNILVIGGFCLILFKAFRLQVLEYSTWDERARNQVQTTFQVPAYRGSIYDCKGRLLSYSVPQPSLYADGDQIENPKKMAAQLAALLGEPEAAIEKKLVANRHFVWLKRHLTDQQAAAIETMNRRGLSLTREYKRFYPYRQVAGQVLGFVGMDGVGLEGVEKSFDQVLRENATSVGQVRDGIRKCLWMRPCLPPEPGESFGVRLALDTFIQYVSECELEAAMAKYKAKAGEVVVVDAQTSEVLAIANWPPFDPNHPDKRNPNSWRNRVITDSFEPGSTFKVFLVSAALDEGVIKEKDRIFCENGKCKLAGHVINDTHPYGWLTIPEVVKYSSNIGASKLALQMGNERYARYIKAFGFGSPTGISLPGEVKGLLRNHKRWRPIDLATTGFGQSIGVTAMQLNSAIQTIANGGEFIEPQIAKEILDAQGQPVSRYCAKPLRRVMQKQTADRIRAMMELVTKEGGTGTSAVPEGYTVAGKTGTAQVLDSATGRYASNKYTAVFTGFVPADKPRLVMTVVIHEPQGAIYGGVVSAPVFKNISAKVLPYLGVQPTLESVPPAKGLRLAGKSGQSAAKAPADASKAAARAAENRKPVGTAARAGKPDADKTLKAGASDGITAKSQAKPAVTRASGLEQYSLKAQTPATGTYQGTGRAGAALASLPERSVPREKREPAHAGETTLKLLVD